MPDDVPITVIVASCLDDFEQRGDEALREHCARHPEIATVLRKAVDAVNNLQSVSGAIARSGVDLFADRYRLEEKIGAGGMGTVYRATDTKLDRVVALKQVRLEFAGVEEVRQRFDREVRAATRVEHPNLCHVYDGGVWENIPYMVMELIEGQTLHDQIHDEGRRPDPQTLVAHVESVGRALHAVHEAGMLHRDIKPANIMIRRDGEPVLLDFGLARETTQHANLTRMGSEPGTWSYMSPEQISPKGRTLDRRTDVYALGLVLYEVLTAHRAFDGGSEHELKTRILREMPQAVRRRNAKAPTDLVVVIEKAIAKNRDDRYATAEEFSEDLRRARSHEPVTARRFGPALRAWRWSQRNPMLAALLVVLSAGIATSTTLFLQASNNLERFREQEKKTRAEVARSAVVLAQRHAQRGDWHAALQAYDKAEAAGYPNEIELSIGRIIAWENSFSIEKATAELARIGTGENLGEHRAEALLLDADINVNRLLNPNHKVKQIELALKLGLSKADEAFAKAVLAPTVHESIQHLDAALAEEPSHRRALELLGNLSLVSGRTDIGRKVAHMRRALYPDNPTNVVFEAFVIGWGERGFDPGKVLNNAAPEVREMVEPWIPLMEKTGELIRAFDQMQVACLVDPDFDFWGTFGKSWMGFLKDALALLRGTHKSQTGMVFRVTPNVAKAVRKLVLAMMSSVGTFGATDYAGALMETGRVFGDGMFFFGAGTVDLMKKRFDAAEKAFRLAASRPSLVLSRRTIDLYLLDVYRQRARQLPPAKRKTILPAARPVLDAVLAHEHDDAQVFRYLYESAVDLGALPHALEIALRWRRRFPDEKLARAALNRALGWIHANPSKKPSTKTGK